VIEMTADKWLALILQTWAYHRDRKQFPPQDVADLMRELGTLIESAELWQRGERPVIANEACRMETMMELHTHEEVEAEVERMKRSPEMLWWLCLVYGDLKMRGAVGESTLRTEAYNRLTARWKP
jgi:hypothetical protein